MWKNKKFNQTQFEEGEAIHLGIIKPMTKHKVVFKYEGDDIEIQQEGGHYKISSDCGCVVSNWNNETKELTLTYDAAPIPEHLVRRQQFNYPAEKRIIVQYISDNTYYFKNLFIRALVKER